MKGKVEKPPGSGHSSAGRTVASTAPSSSGASTVTPKPSTATPKPKAKTQLQLAPMYQKDHVPIVNTSDSNEFTSEDGAEFTPVDGALGQGAETDDADM